MSLSPRAAQLLTTVRNRHPIRAATRLPPPPRRYKVLALCLYLDQLEYLNSLADALRRHPNERPNRSGAIQWLIEQHRSAAKPEPG